MKVQVLIAALNQEKDIVKKLKNYDINAKFTEVWL